MMAMDAAKAVEIFYIELWHFLALFISLAINYFFYIKGEKGPLLWRYLALQAALILWIVSKIGKTLSPTVDLRWFFIVTQYLGVCFLGPLFLFFSWRYFFRKCPPRILQIILYTSSMFLFLIVATNPHHFLFYRTYNFYRDTFGPLFYCQMGYTYLLILISMGISIQAVLKWSRSQWDILIGLSSFFPLMINIFYIVDIINPLFDITPLTMTGSLTCFGIAAFRSHFLGLLPIAQTAMLEHLEDPLILTNRYGKVKKTHIFEKKTHPLILVKMDDKIYRLHRRKSYLLRNLYHYIEITALETLKNDLREKNALLEESIEKIHLQNKEKLRLVEDQLINHSRRELHDILGHSLTQVILLLRTALLENLPMEKKQKRVLLSSEIIEQSLKELQNSLSGKLEENQILTIALQKIISEFSQIEKNLEFIIRGKERHFSQNSINQLVRCCQEGITNSLKHGLAENIYLTVFFSEEKLIIILADTGSGCDKVQRGNGLNMMTIRLKELGGSLRISSEKSHGFQLTMTMPYEKKKSEYFTPVMLS